MDESREASANGIATLDGSSLIPVGISGNATSGGGQVPEATATALGAVELATSAEAITGTDASRVITADVLQAVLDNAAGILGDLKALADPNADRILFWDDGAGAAAFLTASTGLTITGTNLTTDDSAIVHDSLSGFVANEHIDHTAVTLTAGAGLTGGGDISTNRSFAVGAGTGIAVNADDVALDPSGLTEIGIEAFSQSADGFLVSDGGTPKVMPYDASGVKVVNATDAAQTFAQTDAQTIQVLDGVTDRQWTIPPASTYDFDIGTIILCQSINTGRIQITAGTGVVLSSIFNTASTTATSVYVQAGGRAALIKVANDEWTVSGNITSS